MENLLDKKCQVCEYGDLAPFTIKESEGYLQALPMWQLSACGKKITRIFEFKGFYKTMAFVNAVAWVANSEGHHPDLHVSFNRCVVDFTTHAVDGLTENDFICAAKVDALLA
ncbi:4a-hydroxytetrahydrobiopterin dehydratase [Cysteiniphilum halobium]|uniref:4a-hydroxytetrahydrobiopterin dehydratase n=1 Tax=Cysteiniphilum halobium TaxID=2219059 RepID=UPI000E65A8D2|nr:4a-hydroxytetrahydrobiopterin dehydratase [Cysteiniphilum halobium]